MAKKLQLQLSIDRQHSSQNLASETRAKQNLAVAVKHIQLSWYTRLQEAEPEPGEVQWYQRELESQQKLTDDFHAISIQDIQTSLNRNHNLLIFLAGSERYSGINIDNDSIQHFDIGERIAIDNSICDLAALIANPDCEFTTVLQELSDQLIPKDIAKRCKSHVLLAPTHTMYSLPNSILSMLAPAHCPQQFKVKVVKGCNIATERAIAIASRNGVASTFLAAGKKYQLMHSWPLPDVAIMAFSQVFFTALSSGKNIDTALALATIDTRRNKRFSHPYYWAGFICPEC